MRKFVPFLTIAFAATWIFFGSASAADAGPLASLFMAGAWFQSLSLAAQFLVSMAMSLVMTGLQMLLMKKPPEGGGLSSRDTKTGESSAETFILGRYATGGQWVVYPYTHDVPRGDWNEWMTYVIAISDLPIDELRAVYISGDRYTISSTGGDPLYGQRLISSADKNVNNQAFIRFYDGTQTAVDPMMMEVYQNHAARPWQDDMVGTGVAYAVVNFKFHREKFSGFPDQMLFEVDGMKLLDPRDGQTKFTRNPIVMVWNIIHGIQFPDGSSWGINAPAESMSDHRWFAAMNACDELVPVDGGGLQPRYQAGYEVAVDREPLEIIDELLKSCGGKIAEYGGFYDVTVGAPDGSVAFITDGSVIIDEPRDYTMFGGLETAFNGISSTYPDKENAFQETEAIPYKNQEWIAHDDGRELIADAALPTVIDGNQVRRLMRELAADNRRQRQHVITLGFEYLFLKPLDNILWTSVNNGYDAKLFEIGSVQIDPQALTITISIRERDPEDYSFDSDFDGQVPVFPDTNNPTVVLEGEPGINVAGIALADGNKRRAAIRLSWTYEGAGYGISYRVRRMFDTDDYVAGTVPDLSAGIFDIAEGIYGETQYQVSLKPIMHGRQTEYGQWITVTTPPAYITGEELSQNIRDTLDNAFDLANQAAQDAEDASNKADGLQQYVDDTVDQAKNDMAVDYAAAQQAVADAIGAAQDAGEFASDANQHKIDAETAKSQSEVYRDESVIAANGAAGSASQAAISEGLVVSAGINGPVLPSRFADGLKFWTSSRAGSPDGIAGVHSHFSFVDDPIFGPAARYDGSDNGRNLLTKGVMPWGDGKAYRVTMTFRVIASAHADNQAGVALQWTGVDDAYGSDVILGASSGMFPADGSVQTISAVFSDVNRDGVTSVPSQPRTWARFGFRNNRSGGNVEIVIQQIRVEDVTAPLDAANHATAAYNHSVDAGSFADDAGASAYASEQSKLEAQAAAGDAGQYASDAGVYRDDAVTAAQDAEDAAASAYSNLTLTAEVASRGNGVLSDSFLQSSQWTRWQGQGTRTIIPNIIYKLGNTWDFNITNSTQNDGFRLYSNETDSIWVGQQFADAYVIEVEFTLKSGSINGASVLFDWSTTDNVYFRSQKRLADMVAGQGPGSQLSKSRVARGVFIKPTNYSGTFQRHTLHVIANGSIAGATPSVCNIQFHRVSIRPATEEELGKGQVMTHIGAYISENYFTRAETDQAIANYDLTLNATFNGVKATAERADTAIAGLNGSVARTRNMVTVDGVNYAGLEAVAFNGAGMGTGTVLKLYGDQVIAPKSLSAGEVVVHDGSGNLFPDPQFIGLSLAGWRRVNGQSSFAGPVLTTDLNEGVIRTNAPAPAVFRFTNHAGQGHYVLYGPTFEASAGNVFNLGFDYAVGPANHVLQLRVGWIDNTGAVFARDWLGAATAPAIWQRFSTDVTAPAGTVAAQIEIVSLDNGTMTSWSAATNFTVIRKRSGATLITPNSITSYEVNSESLLSSFADIETAFITDAHILGKLNARNISLIGNNNGFSAGKASLNDPSDGMYFGRGANGQFGFAMSRESSAGTPQAMRLTQNEGINILNARFTLTGSAAGGITTLTTNQTVNLPAGSRSISMVLVGGGVGGSGFLNDSYSIGRAAGGGTTTVRILDGTTVVQEWTAAGGSGENNSYRGEHSALDTSDTGAATMGRGGMGVLIAHRSTRGGRAGQSTEVVNFDISGLANPRIQLVRGTGSAGGGHPAYAQGQQGGHGAVRYQVQAYTETPADVLPLIPTATGSFSKPSNATGANVFPNLGTGMWHIFCNNNDNIDIGVIEITTLGHTVRAVSTNALTFIANKRPVVLTGWGSTRTIYYHFYRMGDWG